jgi:DNA polymerase-3 subunit epsilon
MLRYHRNPLNSQNEATQWARDLLAREPNSWVILDSETTGLSGMAEICQIAVIDGAGNVLMDKLVKPTKSIPESATAIHRVTNEMVQEADTFNKILLELQDILNNKVLVIYNSEFDLRMIKQSAEPYNKMLFLGPAIRDLYCAMKKYAQWVGEWNPKTQDYKWKPLPGGDHSAVGDCQAVLSLIKKMAGVEAPSIEDETYPELP